MTPDTPRLRTVMIMLLLTSGFIGGCGSWEGLPGPTAAAEVSPAGGAGAEAAAEAAPHQVKDGFGQVRIPAVTPGSPPSYSADEAPAPTAGPPAPDRIAYLTFDDGPSGNTDAILKLLRQYGVHATFFVTGKESEGDKDLYRRMAAEGHKLGNHTFSHDYAKLYREPAAFMEDVRKLDRFLVETVGQGSDILRFPGGSNTRLGRRKGQAWIMPELVRRVKAEGYQYFDWNVTSTDAAQAVQPKADIISSVMALARGKERIIVLMHDVTAKTTTVEALPEIIRGLQSMGFRFATLDKQAFTTQFLKSD